MKKLFSLLLLLLVCLGLLAGCGNREEVGAKDAGENAESSAFPVTAAYTTAERQYDYVYETAETEFITYMDIFIHEEIKDVSFGMLNWDGEALYMDAPLFTAPAMQEGESFLAAVVFYGDMTTYGLTFTDVAGISRNFSLMISGMDGSLQLLEY